MQEHNLKTDFAPFSEAWERRKTFEFRREDTRTFNVGDIIYLRELALNCYTGRYIKGRITYILRGPSYDVPSGYVCFSFILLEKDEEPIE